MAMVRSIVLSNKVTESNCFVVAGEDIRIVFDCIRYTVLDYCLVLENDDDECGDKLVPVEFGGVRCFIVLSSV